MHFFKSKQKAWFKPVHKSYLPVSAEGLLVYLIYLIYEVAVPVNWYVNGCDVTELLTSVVPLMVAAAVLTQFIASKNSR